MITVTYEPGSGGNAFTLNKDYEIAIKTCNPHNSAWSYESVERKYGIDITSFKKDPIELSFVFKFRGAETEISKNLNAFFEACEKDILQKKPGKIYFDKEYLTGYFIEKSTEPSDEFYGYEQSALFLAPYPFYITEEKREFPPVQDMGGSQETFLDYEYDPKYDYSVKTGGSAIWTVDHYDTCEFLMTIFGPVENPNININNHPYQIYTDLGEGEYLNIDSRNNTVVKTLNNGFRQSVYDLRAKQESVFDRIETGRIKVEWQGHFGFDLTLFTERSEPKWKTGGS